ncbi:MAG: 4Fe-4S binding protein [Planctomycetes bacterium]|nr:4Fe-4S binding protein [Planctomycetota bacterium]
MIRDIVVIDEEKCDGCGLCVPACHEGAIRIVDGKARLVADNLCDGLGACLGHCPQGAIRVERRAAAAFDELAAAAHLASGTPEDKAIRAGGRVGLAVAASPASSPSAPGAVGSHAGGCPSQRFARLGAPGRRQRTTDVASHDGPEPAGRSELAQWPVQLRLLPPRAPVFQDADLLLTADCVPFALADFHRMLRGHALAIACPKLDDTSSYVPKLTEIIASNDLRSITVVHMEVPCCTGILMMALEARASSGVDVPIEDVTVSIRGEILNRQGV